MARMYRNPRSGGVDAFPTGIDLEFARHPSYFTLTSTTNVWIPLGASQ
jgi:hypothetical protein